MREMQVWFQDQIVGPQLDVEGAIERLRPSTGLEPEECIGLYRGMYGLRMAESLEVDYPVVAAFIGERRFQTLVHNYVRSFPSRSYTLNRLGDHLPEYIASSRVKDHRFLADLARMELAITQVFDEVETPPLTPGQLQRLREADLLTLRLRPVRAARILQFDHPVDDAFQAWRDERPLAVPAPKRSWLLIHRSDYTVLRNSLTEASFKLLSSLAEGATVLEALERSAGAASPAELLATFRDWAAAGVFGAI